jgi:hypothetical protein
LHNKPLDSNNSENDDLICTPPTIDFNLINTNYGIPGNPNCTRLNLQGTINGSTIKPSTMSIQWSLVLPSPTVECGSINVGTLQPTIGADGTILTNQYGQTGTTKNVTITMNVIYSNFCPPVSKSKTFYFLIG